MNIKMLDLNLLKAFDALYREQNVTRAGELIGLAQPSMSNALSRLRAAYGDPLFVRRSATMIPTPRAEQLASSVRAALDLIEGGLSVDAFDPATATDQLRIAAPDNVVAVLAPRLAALLAQEAPHLRLAFLPLGKKEVFKQLERGRIDLVIGAFTDPPDMLERRKLMRDRFVCIAREGHLALAGDLSLEAFTGLRHVLMTLNEDDAGVVDAALKRLGRTRRVALTCAQFTPIPDIVAGSDMIATVPASLASTAMRAGCDVHPLPLDLPEWTIDLLWPTTSVPRPALNFAISMIGRAIKGGLDQQ